MARSNSKLFYKIGEVCEIFGLEPHVLRYWESEFPLLSPQKNRAGQRIYRQKDLELIETIRRLLYDEGHTIAGAKKKLQTVAGGRGLPLFQHSSEAARNTALAQIRRDVEKMIELLGN